MKHIHDVIREHLLKGSLQDKYITRSPEELSLIHSVFKLDMNRLDMGMYIMETMLICKKSASKKCIALMLYEDS